MSAKRLAIPNFTLKKKLILIIMFLVLLQNIVLLIFANYQFSQKELKSSVEHIQNECHLLYNDMKTQYHNVILCSNELINTINQTQSYYFSNPANSYLKSAFNYNLHLFSFVDSVVYLTVMIKLSAPVPKGNLISAKSRKNCLIIFLQPGFRRISFSIYRSVHISEPIHQF